VEAHLRSDLVEGLRQEVGVYASVVAGVDAPPVLELAEHVLDLVALAVERSVVGICTLRLAFDGMQGAMPRSVRACAEPVGVVALVAEQRLGGGKASSIRAAPL
jgi:hypothetical protein